MISDLRLAFRQLTKSPGFTAVAVLTLALGIGATTIVFSLAKALVLDPFPYPEPDRIAYVWSDEETVLSPADFYDLQAQAKSFVELGVYTQARLNLGLTTPEPVYAAACTPGVLRAFGIRPALGRWFENADDVSGAPPVVVISHKLWARVFASDPAAIGRTLRLDGMEHTVIGIMPANFEFASPWHDGHDRELWLPLRLDPAKKTVRGDHWLLAVGRLRKDCTPATADAEIKTIGAQLAKEYPNTNLHKPFLVRSLWSQMTERIGRGTSLLFGAVTLLLLVACANVAGLLLARGTRRQGEFGLRLALGATQRDIRRMLLTESMLLALLAGVAGIVLAAWGLEAMRQLIPPLMVNESRRAAMQLDGTVLVFSLILSTLTALIFGLLPALTAARTSVVETLKDGGRSHTGSRDRHRLLRAIVIGQITAALVLTHGAVLLSSSYLNVVASNRVLDTENVLTAAVPLRGQRYRAHQTRQAFWNQLFDRVRALSGVQNIAITSKVPLEGGNNFDFLVDDQSYDLAVVRPNAEVSYVSPDYFAALGLPLLRGRTFEEGDSASGQLRVVINRTLAERCWPGQNPQGKRIRSNNTKSWFDATVVGVVSDARQWGPDQPVQPEVFFKYEATNNNGMTLVIRTVGEAQMLLPLLRAEIAAIDPELPLANVRTLREVLGETIGPRRFFAQLSNGFTVTALLLAVVGIYGTLSFTLVQRRRELGIRIAIGALRSHILRLVLSQAGAWITIGLLIGSASTFPLALLLRSSVYGISPFSPWPLLAAAVCVVVAVFAACLAPTLRATRVSPIEALRAE